MQFAQSFFSPHNDKDCIRSEVKRIPDTIG